MVKQLTPKSNPTQDLRGAELLVVTFETLTNEGQRIPYTVVYWVDGLISFI